MLQVVVWYLGAAAVALFVLWHRIPAPPHEVLAASRPARPTGRQSSPSSAPIRFLKPTLIDFAAPLHAAHRLHGLDAPHARRLRDRPDLVQRLLTCRSAVKGSRSMLGYTLLNIPVVLLFAVVGLLLWVFYTRPDLMGGAGPAPSGTPILPPTARRLPPLHSQRDAARRGRAHDCRTSSPPDPQGINASLNSMASTFVNDIYKPLLAPPERPAVPSRTTSRSAASPSSPGASCSGIFALACIWWQRASGQLLIDFVLNVMNYAYAGLLAVFLTALLTRRGSANSAIAALIVGFLAVLALEPTFWKWGPGRRPGRTQS